MAGSGFRKRLQEDRFGFRPIEPVGHDQQAESQKKRSLTQRTMFANDEDFLMDQFLSVRQIVNDCV